MYLFTSKKKTLQDQIKNIEGIAWTNQVKLTLGKHTQIAEQKSKQFIIGRLYPLIHSKGSKNPLFHGVRIIKNFCTMLYSVPTVWL